MFDAIGKQWQQLYGINGQQAPIFQGDQSGRSVIDPNFSDLGFSGDPTNRQRSNGLNDQFLKNLGWTGGNPYRNAYDGQQNESGPTDQNAYTGYTPEWQQFLQDKGITLKTTSGGPDLSLVRGFDASGNPIGTPYQQVNDGDPAFGVGMALAGGFAGASAAGAFGGSGAFGTGASSGGGLAGTGLPEYAANPYGYGGALTASSEAGIPAGSIGATSAAGGSADLAALYGPAGYGAAASPAELAAGAAGAGGAAGGAGGGGFLSSLGNAASGASDWMKANPTLTNIGGGLLNSAIGYVSSNNALNAQKDATNSANQLLQPYRDTGVAALGKLNGLMQNPGSITSDPGYQFGLNQGQTAIDRSAASKGGMYSGATLKALGRYGQDYAGTKLNDAYNRYQGTAQLGLGATNTQSNNLTGLGNAGAAASLYNGNTFQSGVNNALAQFNQSTYGPGGQRMQYPGYGSGH